MQNDRGQFQNLLRNSKFLVILTGAGVSAESGVPTFRGAGGLWREYNATELANPDAWQRNPGLVWEFYNYRRQVMHDKHPNPAHYAIADIEKRFIAAGRQFHLVTQNIDDLHFDAGSQRVTRMHGSLWKVRCTGCGEVTDNRDVPITPAYEGSGSPDANAKTRKFTKDDMPICDKCGKTLRPHVVWFGESLDKEDMETAFLNAQRCDLFMVVGTSSVVYPAAGLGGVAKNCGAPVAVVNLEDSPASNVSDFFFQGKAGEILPGLLDVEISK